MRGGYFIQRIQLIKKQSFILLLTLTAFLLTSGMVATGAYMREQYALKIGDVSPKRFAATKESINQVSTERRIQEVRNSIKPLYKQDPETEKQALIQISDFFEAVAKTKKPHLYGYGDPLQHLKQETALYLTDDQYSLSISLDDEIIKSLKENTIDIVQATLNTGIKQDGEIKSLLDVKDEFEKLPYERDITTLAYSIASVFIKPNIVIDEESTQQMIAQKISEVEPVWVLQGQKIVDQGEIITEEIYYILESLNLIDKGFQKNYFPYIGGILLVLLLQIFFYVYIQTFHKHISHQKKEILMIFTIYCITIGLIRLMTQVPFILIPISIAGMLIAILLDVQLAIMMNLLITSIAALIYKGNLQFVLFFIISGTLCCILVMHTYQRNKILWVAFLISVVNSVIMFGLGLFFDKGYSVELFQYCIFAFLNGILSVIITVGSLPFWEGVFDAITPFKLLDLTNPSQPLLRKLMIEAPGTYHHSLLVANLSEMAVSDMGGNPILARVGGYYHDIGKLYHPQYFKENQMMDNPHDLLEPMISAKIIKRHIKDGLEIATSYKLPRVIKDIIQQHHGTTLIKYFYYKAVKESVITEVTEEDFRYKGPKPQNKEAAAILLADTVEAAVRAAMPNKQSMKDIENLVRILIKEKLDDGQLEESTLTIKDLDIICVSFMKVFSGMYHERIPYPTMDKKEADEDADLD